MKRTIFPYLIILSLTFSVGNVFSQAVDLNYGLVAYYPFNGNANDESGNENHGLTSGGAELTEDRFGNPNSAYSFGGIDKPSHIRVPSSNSLNFESNATYSFFVKMNSERGMDGYGRTVASGNHCLFAKDHDRSGYCGWIYSNENGAGLWTGIIHISWGGINNSLKRLNDGRWIHVAFVYEENISKIYIDGQILSRTEYSGNINVGNNRDLYFGKFSDYWYPFDGVLDDIRIYNRALNLQEIQTLYGEETSTIISPKIGLLSLIANVGEPFEVKGKDFTSNSAAKLIFTRSAESFTANITTNADGEFSYSYDTKTLGSGRISVYAIDESTNSRTPVREFIVSETVQDVATIRILSPVANLPEKTKSFVNIAWIDILAKTNGTYHYPTNDVGNRMYDYTIEYQTSENGLWNGIDRIRGNALLQTTFSKTITTIIDSPTDYFRVRIVDNYYPDNTAISEICKVFAIDSKTTASLQWDYSFPQPFYIQPKGVAADGVARLFVKVADEQNNIKSVSATLSDDYNNKQSNMLGKLYRATEIKYSLEANNATQTSISDATPNFNDEVWFWYIAPDDFSESPESSVAYLGQRIVKINIEITKKDNTVEKQTLDVAVVRPPLMMVHGLGGNEDTWKNFKYRIGSNEFFFRNSPIFNQKKAVNLKPNATYLENAMILLGKVSHNSGEPNSFHENIAILRGKGFAANQVDYVCHSMGGTILRTAANQENAFYGRGASASSQYRTYDKGFVNKAITINTPHNGSPIADFLTTWTPVVSDALKIHPLLSSAFHFGVDALEQSFISVVGAHTLFYYDYEASPAVKNLQVGSNGYKLAATYVKNHLIAGSVSNYEGYNFNISDVQLESSAIKYYIDFIDVFRKVCTTIETNRESKNSLKALNKLPKFERVVRFLELYTMNNILLGDLIVPLPSQMATTEYIGNTPNNITIFHNTNLLLNANHLSIVDRVDVGNRIMELLNTAINSQYFGDIVNANASVRSSTQLKTSEFNNIANVMESHFDNSHIEIIAPNKGKVVYANENIEIIYQLKNAVNLDYIEYMFQNSHDIMVNTSELQSLNLNVSPDFLGNQTIYISATYDIENKTVSYIDTLSINVVANEKLIDFKINSSMAHIYKDARYYPQMTAVYETFLSNVSTSSDKLNIQIQDPSVIGYDDILHCFIGLKGGSTFVEIMYENLTDTLYFNVMELQEVNETSIKEIHSEKSTSILDAIIYPNPVDEEFSLYVENADNEKTFIAIYNMQGQKIEAQTTSDNSAVFNINQYQQGIYFIRIMTESGKSVTKKLIKK